MINKLKNYENNYMYHGSSKLVNEIILNQAHDSSRSLVNIDYAVFLTDSIDIASAYAFKDSIKKISEGCKYNFFVSSTGDYPIMQMENVVVNDEIEGYIYVFEKSDQFINDPVGTRQFKSYENLKPLDVIKVYYKDFKHLYEVLASTNTKR